MHINKLIEEIKKMNHDSDPNNSFSQTGWTIIPLDEMISAHPS